MPNSLRSKIKHFCYKGELNERERDRILNALDSQQTAHFIGFENPNYSPFDNDIFSPKVLLKCSECGNAVLSMFAYCPMCGRKLTEVKQNDT